MGNQFIEDGVEAWQTVEPDLVFHVGILGIMLTMDDRDTFGPAFVVVNGLVFDYGCVESID